ncbi:TPA: tetratricopeptide repeat protein [Vibrio parahaemolyticus]|uniref:tetratricopeptide repeat protein n=1 Tax=Vibrio harveyi group TaxID=717610 RepID=UPI00111E3492|nr:tetratricopeptide repeat protein [Vibrio parahaemolyticus]EHR5764904.1 tetratricopeptide repeat protein [Vibrio parahaemolyticus]EHY0932773.1 tetratricopeptide repeat protein [Vibrio parahaemolyticus]EJC1078402.1 tetratricopeptide repeat protein [Vibrio parahaemolyticus]EJC6831951.1 tetratricopeptide repeat protein [Vibrio parahaemolyticus]EJK2183469.1 tetratricopeptide repeat protein [Vibrio parahaemolyticus]
MKAKIGFFLALIASAIAFVWLLNDPGFEPAVTLLVGVSGLLIANHKGKSSPSFKDALKDIVVQKGADLNNETLAILIKLIEQGESETLNPSIQKKLNDGDIDSTVKELKRLALAKENDLAEDWIKIAVLSYFSDPKESVFAFDKAHQLQPDNFELVIAYSDLLIQLSQYDKAQALLEGIIDLKLNDELVAYAIHSLGTTFKNQGKMDDAENLYNEALELSHLYGLKKLEGQIYSSIGLLFKIKGNYQKAIDFYNRSLSILEAYDDKNISTVYGNVAVAHKNAGNFKEARKSYIKALSIDEGKGNLIGQARHCGNLGNLYKEESDFDTAMEYYNKSISLYEKLEAMKDVGVCCINIGIIDQIVRNFDEAKSKFERALMISKSVSHKELEALALYNLASLNFELGDEFTGKDYARQSKKIYESLGAYHRVSELEPYTN